jgi:hypothetical protein
LIYANFERIYSNFPEIPESPDRYAIPEVTCNRLSGGTMDEMKANDKIPTSKPAE